MNPIEANNLLNPFVTQTYNTLPLVENITLIEYVWLQRTSDHYLPSEMMRSKTRIVDYSIEKLEDVPAWSSDALCTCQGEEGEICGGLDESSQGRYSYKVHIILTPIYMINDPFRKSPHKIVLCECLLDPNEQTNLQSDIIEHPNTTHNTMTTSPSISSTLPGQIHQRKDTPTRTLPINTPKIPTVPLLSTGTFFQPTIENYPPSNIRAKLRHELLKNKEANNSNLWLGYEQEYIVLQKNSKPLGWSNDNTRPETQIQYLNYCSSGNGTGRDIMEVHTRCCLYAGLNIIGMNLEVTVGSMEYQLGPLSVIEAADQLWLSRYILARLVESYGLTLSFHPKLLEFADGCGLHTNVSTALMRDDPKGYEYIVEAMEKLRVRHDEHIKAYGPGIELRLSGKEEYSDYRKFTWGVGDRQASIRISFLADKSREGKGYFEDRRPSANSDPYRIGLAYIQTLFPRTTQQTRSTIDTTSTSESTNNLYNKDNLTSTNQSNQPTAEPMHESVDRLLRAPPSHLVQQLLNEQKHTG